MVWLFYLSDDSLSSNDVSQLVSFFYAPANDIILPHYFLFTISSSELQLVCELTWFTRDMNQVYEISDADDDDGYEWVCLHAFDTVLRVTV